MIERVWRHDALRVHLLSHIGVVVASAVVLVAGQPATAQESIDFEDPPYTGSAAGTIITGQDNFYIPVPDSQDGLVYTYAGNALGLPANPSGGGLQFAGVTGGDTGLPVPFARAQRDVTYGAGTEVWTVSFDIAATYIGVLPSAQNIGSFSTQLFDDQATFIALGRWTDPATAAEWNAAYVWFDAGGTQLLDEGGIGTQLPPGFQGLEIDRWHRWCTTFNLDTNQIVEISITNLHTNVTVTHSPVDRYLVGGALGGQPPPSGFRLFGGSNTAGAEGNTLAFDNVEIALASGTPSGACCFEEPTACLFLTEADCAVARGTYSGDWTACTAFGCTPIPKECMGATGNCNEPHGGIGCDNEGCCAVVCLMEPACCDFAWDETCVSFALKLGCAFPFFPTCDPEATAVLDNIGSSIASLGVAAFANQRFPDSPEFDIAAIDDFSVCGGGFIATCMDISASGFNGFENENWNLVESWSVEIYSSLEAAGLNLTGDVASLIVPAPLVEPFGDRDMLRFDLTGIGLLAPGKYWISVIPTMLFDPNGQIGIADTNIGNDDAWQANPGGGFGFPPDGLQQTNANLAYRVVGTELKNPCPADLDLNNVVEVADLLILLAVWGNVQVCADFDGGGVGVSDLLSLLAAWGPCP